MRFHVLVGCGLFILFFFCKQKTAYEMRISDWSSDVCSSDLRDPGGGGQPPVLSAGVPSASADRRTTPSRTSTATALRDCPRHGPPTHRPSLNSKVAPCTAQTSNPSFVRRNSPGAQSRRRPACGPVLRLARPAPPSRCPRTNSPAPSPP